MNPLLKDQENKEYTEYLANLYEGKVLVHVFIDVIGDAYYADKHYYTVKDGQIYIISEGNLWEVPDNFRDLAAQCRVIGSYNPKLKYARKQTKMTYSDILKALKLK